VSVKSDRWILKMCREGGMIKPFEARLVREVEGRRIISAGVSSYGYDLRLAQDGFRVFSPIASAEIDPKNFDENSLVEAPLRVSEDGSQYWLLPPHSYALGVTVETFDMPRNVVAYCLGKSTYARCFRGDTRVALADGSSPKIGEMAARSEKGELFWGYSIGEHGRVIITLLESPRYIGRDSLLRVTLDNGEEILCTPDHQFLLRDGRIAPACKLQPGTSLMPLYRKLLRGYEMVYQPINGHFFPTHRLADEWNLRHGIYEDVPGIHRHHLDEDRINNQPPNVVRMNASDHIRYHNGQTYGIDFDPEEHGASIRAAFERLYKDDNWRRQFAQQQKRRVTNFWGDEKYAEARQRLIARFHARWTPEPRAEQRAKQERFWNSHPEAREVVSERNHKVGSVKEEKGEHDVFCLTVPEAGNFALAAGVFVENCGLIVNATPLEPGWRGRLVLEFSNSADLPIRIYANEGIAQVTFFESDEDCETSYADRAGKYQDQVGLVTPRL
jgi:deoxycytidine triphosphate deaminase